MMSLSELSIRKPVFAWMLMAALILFGYLCFDRLGISQLPDVDFPVVSVGLSLNGASPEVMESQVIDPVEDVIMQIDGIRNISSNSSQGSGSISVEFELGRDIDSAVQDVENRIKQVQNLLPQNILPPTVRKTNPEDQPILWLAVTTDDKTSLMDLMIYSRNTLFNQFATVRGVGDIVIGGYVDPALRVWLDLDKLTKFDLTANDVYSAIQNEQLELPAGRIESPHQEYNVRLMGEARSAKDFGKIRISKRASGVNYRPTELNQVARIEEGTADIRRKSRFNGQLAVGLGVLKQHGSNAVEVAKLVRAKLKDIEASIPKNFKVSVRSDQTRFIKQSVDQLNFTLVLSAILTSLVCFLFLGSWTSTLNVLMAIPTSIIGSFIVLYAFGFTLNTFTLLGLSLAIGIVVDDAIMMLENIVRHRQLGEKKRAAALKGSAEIKFAAIAATVAVCAIFLPVIFMKGVIGRYFFQYGITVTAAVLLSLLEALTLTPMRCAQYLKVEHKPRGLAAFMNRAFDSLNKTYQKILSILLNHPYKTLSFGVVLFISSIYIVKFIPSEMMPAQDQSIFMLRLKGTVGSSIESTDEKLKIVEKYLSQQKVVEGYFSAVGGFGGDAVNQGQVFVTLVEANKRKLSQLKIMDRFRTELKPLLGKMQLVAQDFSMRGFGPSRGFPIEFVVQGPNWDILTASTQKLMDALTETKLVTDINTDIQNKMPQYQITPNREKLASHGVTLQAVTSAISTLVGGGILNGQVEYPKAGHRYAIEVRLEGAQRERSEQLKLIRVSNNRGEVTPLADLVDIHEMPSLMTISRLNRSRAITVYANLALGHSQQEVLKVAESTGQKLLPQGYYLKLSGSTQNFKENFQSLYYALALGFLISYMVLASQFNSFIHPIAVLLALPFSFSGAFVALFLTHQSINIYSLIGFILLMGIVKKNSILLVDFTNHLRRSELKSVKDALIHACPVRLRPILMTSVATIAGALPEALSMGPGAETTIPMAIAIIGGVIASTLLTLFVVPCAYLLLSKLESKEVFDLSEIESSAMSSQSASK
jgi:hydrophobe/amphiphile efflux-1 (HAE1) family protein